MSIGIFGIYGGMHKQGCKGGGEGEKRTLCITHEY